MSNGLIQVTVKSLWNHRYIFKYTVRNFGQMFLKQKIHCLKRRAIHFCLKKTLYSHFQLLPNTHLLTLWFGQDVQNLDIFICRKITISLRYPVICVSSCLIVEAQSIFSIWWLYGVKDERKLEKKQGKRNGQPYL